MSKQKVAAGLTWLAAAALIDKVKFVLQQAQNNRYSVSRIYAAHNGIFELTEEPQTCATCLTSRVKRLREWWHANAPVQETGGVVADAANDPAPKAKTKAVKATGEAQEAISYEGVVSKYKLPIGDGLGEVQAGSEGDVLQEWVSNGQEASGMTANEFALLEARYGELVGAAADTALLNTVTEKLNALGIHKDSSDKDALEAYEVLAANADNPPNEQAFYNAQIEILNREIATAGEVLFTPASDGAQFGIATKGGEPLPAGNYDHDGQQYAVNGTEGHYTVITGEPAGEAAKAAALKPEDRSDLTAARKTALKDAQSTDPNAPSYVAPVFKVIDMGEGVLGMHFTPSAEDAAKGTIVNADGSKVKAGTYDAADGTKIAVQVGGKATIK